jgi:hypothetical protein
MAFNKNKFLFRVKNSSGLGKKDRHPLNIKGALSAKNVKLNGQISNYSIKIFFPREVRDKNKESSIYTQNS